MMDELTRNIENWACNRDLDVANPGKQMLKLGEEYGELCAAMARGKHDETKDAIGDMFVVLTILSLQLGTDIDTCVEHAYQEIKNRTGKMVDGVFVKTADLEVTA